MLFIFPFCHAFLFVHCSLVVTCWERNGLLALLYVMFHCVLVTYPCGVLRSCAKRFCFQIEILLQYYQTKKLNHVHLKLYDLFSYTLRKFRWPDKATQYTPQNNLGAIYVLYPGSPVGSPTLPSVRWDFNHDWQFCFPL